MNLKTIANVLLFLSILSVLIAAIGSFGANTLVSSTQWLLIAAVLAIYALFVKMK